MTSICPPSLILPNRAHSQTNLPAHDRTPLKSPTIIPKENPLAPPDGKRHPSLTSNGLLPSTGLLPQKGATLGYALEVKIDKNLVNSEFTVIALK